MQRQSWTLLLVCSLLLGAFGVVHAQDFTRISDDGTTTLTGWLSVTYGDPLPGSTADGHVNVILEPSTDESILLDMPTSAAQQFHAQQVNVTGEFSPLMPPASSGIDAVFNVTTLDKVALAGTSGTSAPQVTGNQPWVNLLCRFKDDAAEPRTPGQIQTFFGDNEPGLNHYWQQLSYNQINITGTATGSQWREMPQPLSFYYTQGQTPNLDAMMEDCTEAFDAEIDFTSAIGINAFFNANFGCCAWGGGKFLSLDGENRIFRTTWIPPAAIDHSIIAHEMGHGWGWPHSSGPSDNPPLDLSIYVSQWDLMSRAGGDGDRYDSNLYRFIGQGTIAEYLHDVGWIPESRRVVVNDGQETTVTLERTHLPTSNTSILMVEIPIDNSTTQSYTVEARKENGYDLNTPAPAVVIHRVNENWDRSSNRGPALVVDANDGNDNVNDAGAAWLPGETFVDAANNIEIEVLSSTATTYTVRISNDAGPQAQELITNGNFSNGLTNWGTFGDIDATLFNGGVNFHRENPGWGGATVFQSMNPVNLSAGEPIVASVDLQNLSGVPKAVEVVFRTQSFSEQVACSVTLPPQSGVQKITMRDVLSTSWSDALFAVRALDPDGTPNIRMDNVSVQYLPGNTTITGYSCSGDVTNNYENLLSNGNFSNGLRYWIMYGDYQFAINNGILTFYRTSGATRPAVAFNNGGHYIPTGSKLQLQVRIGNTSNVAKQVNVVVRDQFWSQQMSCSYTVPANTPMTTVTVKGTAVKNWANPMVLIRNLSADGAPNLLVDDANLQIRPAMTIDSNCGNPFGGAIVTDDAKAPTTILPDTGIAPDTDGAAPVPVAPPNPGGIPEIPGF